MSTQSSSPEIVYGFRHQHPYVTVPCSDAYHLECLVPRELGWESHRGYRESAPGPEQAQSTCDGCGGQLSELPLLGESCEYELDIPITEYVTVKLRAHSEKEARRRGLAGEGENVSGLSYTEAEVIAVRKLS